MQQVKVTLDNYKDYVEARIREWTDNIVWGGNASKVQDVMVFPEEYLCGKHIEKKVRNQIMQYLLSNKFSFSFVMKDGKREREWAMPTNPLNEPFISIRSECAESWSKAKEFFANKAKDELRNYAQGTRRMAVFKTDNSLYRQSLREELLRYPAYVVSTTYAKDWVYAAKYGAPYDKLHEDYSRYMSFVNLHIKQFFMYLEITRNHERYADPYFEGVKIKYREVKPAVRFCFSASMATAHDVVRRLERFGYDVSLFPMHERSTYQDLGIKPYDGIPVFIEIPEHLVDFHENN